MRGVWRWCLLHTFHSILAHSWRPLDIFYHSKSISKSYWIMKFRHKAAHLFLETIRTVKTSFHFHYFVASLVTNYFFLSFSKVCCGRGLSLHLPSWRRDRGISRVPSEAETKEMWRAYQVGGVWYPVSRTARAGGGGLIPCHNICQTLAQTIARWRVVTGGFALYVFVLLYYVK